MSTAATAATAPQQQGGFRRFWRTLRQIFHEVTAAVFAVLALAGLKPALRAWNRDTAHWLIAAAIAVAFLLALFAVIQFRKTRKLYQPEPRRGHFFRLLCSKFHVRRHNQIRPHRTEVEIHHPLR